MEYFDVCDQAGLPTGEIVERKEAHRLGIRHRTAHIWILRRGENGPEVLLQKRCLTKDSFPGWWDTSSAGHIPAGCEPMESALRELSEELGLEAAPDQITKAGEFDIYYELPFHGSLFIDNEHTTVYVYELPLDITALHLQAEEVEKVDWFPVEKVRLGCVDRGDWCCVPTPGFNVLLRYTGYGKMVGE